MPIMSHLATWVWLAKVAWGGNGGASSSTDASTPNWLTRSCVLRPEHPSDQGVLAEHKPQGTVAKCPDFKMDKHEVERDPVRGITSCKCLPGLPWVPPRCREGKSTRRDDRPLCSLRSGCSKVTRRRRLGRTDLRVWEVFTFYPAKCSVFTDAGGVIAGPVIGAGVVLQGGALTSCAASHTVSCLDCFTYMSPSRKACNTTNQS